jgi:hypothetical protein
MRFFRSRAVLLFAACVLAAASGMIWAFFPGGREAGVVPPSAPALIPVDADGELSFAETDIDLGLINEPTKHDVEFTNRSDHVVRIGKIRTSCNCTTTQPDKQVLQPGEKGRVSLDVQPHTDHIGLSRHAITVEYEGAKSREARLEVHYLTKPDVVVPQEIAIRSAGGLETAASFTLVDYRDTPLKITTISASSPCLEARVAEEPSSYLPGWQYRLQVSYSGSGRPPGDYSETVTLHTSDPEREAIVVHVPVHQVSRFRVAPATLHLKTGPDSAEAVGTIYVDDTEGGAAEIESITPSDESLSCTLGGDSTQQTVAVRIRKEELSRLSRSPSIRITMKKPSSEVLCVQIAR